MQSHVPSHQPLKPNTPLSHFGAITVPDHIEVIPSASTILTDTSLPINQSLVDSMLISNSDKGSTSKPHFNESEEVETNVENKNVSKHILTNLKIIIIFFQYTYFIYYINNLIFLLLTL